MERDEWWVPRNDVECTWLLLASIALVDFRRVKQSTTAPCAPIVLRQEAHGTAAGGTYRVTAVIAGVITVVCAALAPSIVPRIQFYATSLGRTMNRIETAFVNIVSRTE